MPDGTAYDRRPPARGAAPARVPAPDDAAAPAAAPPAALADPARLHLLADTGLLEASAVARLPTLDRVARLAARATRAPLAQVNLLTADAQVPAAAFVEAGAPGPRAAPLAAADADLGGAWRTPVGLDASLCQHVVGHGAPLAIPDAAADARARANRATTEGGVRAYAAAPLATPSGHVLGTVCVVDFAPRAWTAADLAALGECAALAGEEVAARLGAGHALADAQRTLDAILEHLPEGLIVASAPDVTIRMVSRYGRELAGRARADVTGIPADLHPAAWDVWHADNRARARPEELPLTRATVRGEVVRDEEWVVRRPDGTPVTILCTAAPIRDAGGAITGGLLAWRDVTTRRAREALLRRLLAFSAALGDAAGPGAVAAAVVRELRDGLGAAAAGVARVAPDDPAQMEVLAAEGFAGGGGGRPDLAPGGRYPADRPLPALDAVRDGGPVLVTGLDALRARYPVLAPLAAATGYASWLAVPCVLGEHGHRRTVGVVGAAFAAPRALTDDEDTFLRSVGRQAGQALERARLYEAEQAARADAEREAGRVARLLALTAALAAPRTRAEVARAILAQAVSAAGAVAGGVLEAAPGGEEFVLLDLAGYDDAVRAAFARFPVDTPVPARDAYRERRAVYLDSPAGFAEAGYRAADAGTDRRPPAAWAALPLLLEGRALGVLALTFDDAARVAPAERPFLEGFARQCAQALDRVALYEAEHAARAEAEAASRVKGEFLANMSHELRTPLNAISGHVQLVELGLHGPVTDAQRTALARVQSAGRHLLGLINDVLNYAKLESGTVEYALAEVDLREVLAAAAPLVEPQRLAKGIAYAVQLPEAGCRVWADRDKLAQVLLNLLSNAVKFTPEGGRVAVRVATPADAPALAVVEVVDTGVGVPAAKLEAIFEPFVQVSASRARGHEGTGLGLTISRDLARGMGGDLTAESVEGQGSTFRLVLRRAVTAAGEPTDRRFRDERRDEADRRGGDDRRADR